ncbi:hypothetical protein [Botrimarina sp.]|uniref:hypothetical protein n=1 Tax=Botrimarina sp. TaxID=2795802 RepID=UPI0032EB0A29
MDDPNWGYYCELRSGRAYHFSGITELGDGWILLHRFDRACVCPTVAPALHKRSLPVPSRGLMVRLSDILWVAEEDS